METQRKHMHVRSLLNMTCLRQSVFCFIVRTYSYQHMANKHKTNPLTLVGYEVYNIVMSEMKKNKCSFIRSNGKGHNGISKTN